MPVDHVWSQIIRILKARGGGFSTLDSRGATLFDWL